MSVSNGLRINIAMIVLTCTRRGEEAQRHTLQVVIELIAEVTHHALTNNIIKVGLPNANNAGDNRRHNHNDH